MATPRKTVAIWRLRILCASHLDSRNPSSGGWILGSGFPFLKAALYEGLRSCTLAGEPEPMFRDDNQGAGASNGPPADNSLPDDSFEFVHHTLRGRLTAIQNAIKLLHRLNYAEPNDWSIPTPTGRPDEMMVLLTKRVRVD